MQLFAAKIHKSQWNCRCISSPSKGFMLEKFVHNTLILLKTSYITALFTCHKAISFFYSLQISEQQLGLIQGLQCRQGGFVTVKVVRI